MTLSLSLTFYDIEQLITDFAAYRDETRLIEIYSRNARNEVIKYYHKSSRMPPEEISVYFTDKDKGIKWYIKSDPLYYHMKYSIKVTINPKILSGTIDYITAATYSDMNIAIIIFNEESKRISPLLMSFSDYKITRVDYCANICLDDFMPGCDPEQIITLIKRGDIPPHYEEWMEYDDNSHRKKSRPESFYLTNKSVTINYYSKYMQLQNRSQKNTEKGYAPIPQSTLDAAHNIIRCPNYNMEHMHPFMYLPHCAI